MRRLWVHRIMGAFIVLGSVWMGCSSEPPQIEDAQLIADPTDVVAEPLVSLAPRTIYPGDCPNCHENCECGGDANNCITNCKAGHDANSCISFCEATHDVGKCFHDCNAGHDANACVYNCRAGHDCNTCGANCTCYHLG